MARTRPLALLATLGSLTLVDGCSSWKKPPVGAGGKPILSGKQSVRVLLASGNTVWLANPQVVGDSLIGEVGIPASRLAVSWSEVRKLDEEKKSTGKGVGLGCAVLLGAVAIGGFLAMIGALLEGM